MAGIALTSARGAQRKAGKMARQTVLVVDDERDIRELLTITLGRMDLDVDTAANVSDAKRMLGEAHYDLCFTDMRLPDGTGQELIELIAHDHPETPIAMITAYGNVEAAVDALKAGAFDFVSKPVDIHMLRRLVQSALRAGQATEQASGDQVTAGRLVGESQVMKEVRARIAKLARSQAPIYISGESGTGKELVARSIHELGPRAAGPFVPVNCGAIPSELMESEFFGHKKGSFTGAHADKEGLFQTAHGGTLFLDEVAELPLHMQVKLLRVIQEKAVRPIGGRGEVPVDVRILSATHKDLGRLTQNGQFRQDLYYRINVIELRVPPLRERGGDIAVLAKHILKRMAEQGGAPAPTLQPAALKALNEYDFPGNVRELENVLERAIALCENDLIEPPDLMLEPASGHDPDEDDFDEDEGGDEDAGSSAKSGGGVGLDDYISNIERETIVKVLKETRYNKTAAAKKLGITFRALRYKLKKLGID
jgi:two-component system response regulator PilR (NtrC family)